MNLLENLNDVQKQIVTDTEGRLLVLAGAGSGKTRVLTHRVAFLVAQKGVFGSNILAITFTNKATAEMRERLNVLLGEDSGVWISTIHALAARILRRYSEHIGYDKDFSIYEGGTYTTEPGIYYGSISGLKYFTVSIDPSTASSEGTVTIRVVGD